MRILGLDVGEKTIGVAVSDLMGWTAQPVQVVRRKSLTEDLAALRLLVEEYAVDKLFWACPPYRWQLWPGSGENILICRRIGEGI